MKFRTSHVLVALAILVLAVDWFVLPRDVLNYRDSLEVVSSSLSLEAAHPTGFPLSILFTKLLSLPLAFIESPYRRVAVVNAFYGVVVLWLVFACLQKLVRDMWVAALGALLVAFGYTFWLYRLVPELFMLANVGGLTSLWLLLMWRDTRSEKWWALFCASLGIGLVLHLTTTVWWPAHLAIFALSKPKRVPRLFAIGAPCAVAGLLPFGLVYVLAKLPHHAIWGNLPTYQSFKDYILRTDYGGLNKPGSIAKADVNPLDSLKAYCDHLWWQFGPFVLLCGLVGFAIKKGERYLAFLPLTIIVAGPVFVLYGRFRADTPFYLGSAEPLYIPSIIAIVMAIVVGAHALVKAEREKNPQHGELWYRGQLAVMGVLVLVQLGVNHHRVDRHEKKLSRDYLSDSWREVPDNAILILSADRDLFGGVYSTWLEHKPQNGATVAAGFVHKPEYHQELKLEHPDLIVNNQLVKTVFVRHFIADNFGKRPIFISNTDDAFLWGVAGNPYYLRPAGKLFEVIRDKAAAAARKTALPISNALGDDIAAHDFWELTLLMGYRVSWQQIGQELIKLGLVDRAHAFFKAIADLDPGSPDWRNELNRLAAGQRYGYEGEIYEQRSFAELDAAGMDAIKTSDYERALILFEMAFRRNPEDAKTANKLAVLYISHHDPEGAKPYAELAVKLDPSSEKYRGDLELVQRKIANGEF